MTSPKYMMITVAKCPAGKVGEAKGHLDGLCSDLKSGAGAATTRHGMIATGEHTGSLGATLMKVADFYEEDVDNAVDNLSSLLEPMIMAILGVLVGGLVVAMYLPIFKMGAVI